MININIKSQKISCGLFKLQRMIHNMLETLIRKRILEEFRSLKFILVSLYFTLETKLNKLEIESQL